jgi:uncharacterized membrane protein
MSFETVLAALGGIVVGFIIGRMTGREKSRIVWSKPIDFDKVDPEILEMALAGEKIQAIKRYRELHGVDLKAAKEAVEAILEHHSRTS